MSKSLNVKVFCRIRPENERELASGLPNCVSPLSATSLKIETDQDQKCQTQEFTFDTVFPSSSSQVDIFLNTAKPLIDSAMQGINGTLFCYGQTSSGKTFTMEGVKDNDSLRGIIPRMMEYIFELIPKASSDIEFSVKCQYYQIYNEKIQDLLDTRKTDLSVREDKTKGIWVEDLTEIYVASKEEMSDVFQCGSNNRTVAATEMNKGSSRSHSLFCVTIFQRNTITGSTQCGKLYFVDLAGSEKMSKTGIEGGMGLKEAQNINKSLMTLGMVINALTEGASHIPYRDSKLTRVLQESLGGNSQTTLIVTCSPNISNASESLSTLRFGQRAKLIKNKVVANTQKSAKELLILLNKANLKIKQLEGIIGKIEKGENGQIKITTNNDNTNSNLNKQCEECVKLMNQIAYLNLELLTSQEESDDLQKDKEDLEKEISDKNKSIYDINDKLQQSQASIKSLAEEQSRIVNEVQHHIDTYIILVKKIESSLDNMRSSSSSISDEVEAIEDYISLSLKNWHQLQNTLNISSFDSSCNSSTIELNNSSIELSSRSTQIVRNINFHINKNINIQIKDKGKRRNTVNYHHQKRKNSSSKKEIAIVELNQKNRQLQCQLIEAKDKISLYEDTIDSLNKKVSDYDDILKALTEKLLKKENEFDLYKEKTMKDFSHKEQKTVELINRITDLEDENYKLTHFTNKDIDKKKFIIMDKQIKSFTVEMQKFMNENNKYKQLLQSKDAEIKKLKSEISDIKNDIKTNVNGVDVSFANKDTVVDTVSILNNLNSKNVIRKSLDSVRSGSSSDNTIKRENSFESITSHRMIKVIRGGNSKKHNCFFAAMLDNNTPITSSLKAISKKKEFQFENEMNILDNDQMSDISS